MSDPRVVTALRPFVLTHWFGHRNDRDIPEIVREVWSKKFQPGRDQRSTRQSNVDFVLLDSNGKLVHWFDAVGSARYGRPGSIVTNTLEQLRQGIARLRLKPGSSSHINSVSLKLPDARPGQGGMRVFVRLDDRRMPAYRLPVVEFVELASEDWTPLAWPERPRTVDASSLGKWLKQVYPPGVMERVDPVTKHPFTITSVSGRLTLTRATPDDKSRYAVASGRVRLVDSGGDGFAFEGDLDLVITYGKQSAKVQTVRGVFRGTYPRLDRPRQTTRHIPLEAVFESRLR